VCVGFNVHAKKGPFWRCVGKFNTEKEAMQRLEDIAEMNRQ